MTLWVAVLVSSLGCAALKQLGAVVPARWLRGSRVASFVDVLPVALLSALIAVSTFAVGTRLALDSRAAGLAVAVALVMVRAPFLVVVVAACAVAAGVHAVAG
jgi:Branched-chain amino acid transport protein (AzlD)